MLDKLANTLSYTALACIFGIATALVAVISFGVFYTTTDIMFKEWDKIFQILFAVFFFTIPLFITLAVICTVRAYKNNEKMYILGMIFGVGPTLYAGFVFLLFVLAVIAYLS